MSDEKKVEKLTPEQEKKIIAEKEAAAKKGGDKGK